MALRMRQSTAPRQVWWGFFRRGLFLVLLQFTAENGAWALPLLLKGHVGDEQPFLLYFGVLFCLGGSMVIYLAGLQGIPESFYEAAKIDGASRGAQLRYITIPLMGPIIFFNLIIGIIASFQVFTAGFLITDGAPQNSTLFYVLYLYRTGFRYLDMGYAAALAWVLFIIILVLTLLIFRYVGRGVHYEDGQ